MSAGLNVIKANDWFTLTQGITRVHQRNTPKLEIYTKSSAKETQRFQRVGIATLAIRVLYSHPTTNDQDPIIRRNEGLRSKGAFKDLDPSTLAYKRNSTLTHKDI
ncbi:hypothetical protein Tco_1272412 [Tanacetum coccineum]